MALNDTPGDLGKALASIQRRLAALERPSSVVIGQWSIHQSQYGDLVADNINTGDRYILADYDKSKKTGPVGINDPMWRPMRNT